MAISSTYETLRRLSLLAIATNEIEVHRTTSDGQQLPVALIAEVISAIKAIGIASSSHYHFTDKILELDSSSIKIIFPFLFGPLECTTVQYQELKKRFQDLTHLNLSGCQEISQKDLLHVVTNIPQVRLINLSDTCCCAETLLAIGSHCPQLTALDVSKNVFWYYRKTRWNPKRDTGVDDNGVKSLCVDENGVCRNLKIATLDICDTGVSAKGALFALNNLPSLVSLAYTNLNGFVSAASKGWNPTEERRNSFEAFSCGGHNRPAWKESVVELAGIFPGLRSLSLCLPSRSLVDAILLFPRLNKLRMSGYFQLNVLKGNALTEVTFDNCRGRASLNLIAAASPNLQKLVLARVSYFANEVFTVRKPFGSLRVASVSSDVEFDPISAKQLLFLLSHARCLQSVGFQTCESFTDEVVDRLLDGDSLSGLRRISMDRCKSVTVRSLVALAEKCVDLQFLDVSRCEGISCGDLSYARAHAKVNDSRAVIRACGDDYVKKCLKKGCHCLLIA